MLSISNDNEILLKNIIIGDEFMDTILKDCESIVCHV